MSKQKILADISEALGCEVPLSIEMSLYESGGWDSLGMLSIISLFDIYGVKLEIDKVKSLETVDQLIQLLENGNE